jgi:translocation and assembly module TamB
MSRKIFYPLLFCFALSLWVLTTESGLKAVFSLISARNQNQISASKIQGTLLSEIQITDLTVRSAHFQLKAATLILHLPIHTLFYNIIRIPSFEIKEAVMDWGKSSNSPLYIHQASGTVELTTHLQPLLVHVQNLAGTWKNQPITGQGGFSILNQQLKFLNTTFIFGQNKFIIAESATHKNQMDCLLTTTQSNDFHAEIHGKFTADNSLKQWSGEIFNTTIDSDMSGSWQQKKPISVSFSLNHLTLQPLVLNHPSGATAQISLEWDQIQGLAALIDIPTLPIKHPNIQGNATLHFDIQQKPKKSPVVEGSIVLPPGNARVSMGKRERTFTYLGGLAKLSLQNENLNISLNVKENAKNNISGNIQITHFTFSRSLFEQPLSGSIEARWDDLSLFDTLIPQISKLKASLIAKTDIRGTLKDPKLSFQAKTEKALFFIPSSKVTVHDLNLSLKGDIPGKLTWTGAGFVEERPFQITGISEISENFQTSLTINGEALQIYNTANMQISADPELTLDFVNQTLFIRGTLNIPTASIDLHNETKRLVVSKDVIFLDLPTEKSASNSQNNFKIVPNIYLTLGKNVYFKGYNLEGLIRGKLAIDERPDGLLAGTGSLTIREGKYRLQGSTRYIHRGRLLFPAGTLLNDPILDILISDKRIHEFQDGSEMGLYIQGTLQKPVAEFYTNANKQNNSILSRLKSTGPEGRGNPKQNQLLANPAFLIGGSANPLLDKIQSNLGILGIEEFSFESRESPNNLFSQGTNPSPAQKNIATQGGTDTVILLGTFLSKKLYLQFLQFVAKPVTAVRLKYFLNPLVTTSVETGTEENIGADLTFSMEKD